MTGTVDDVVVVARRGTVVLGTLVDVVLDVVVVKFGSFLSHSGGCDPYSSGSFTPSNT